MPTSLKRAVDRHGGGEGAEVTMTMTKTTTKTKTKTKTTMAGEDKGLESGGAIVDDVQPLRDLARNFDIDIEPYLREYLKRMTNTPRRCRRRGLDRDDGDDYDDDNDDVYDVDVAADGGGITASSSSTTTTQQAFATAALKIQTSACIYDRKVEYLHRATYVVLDDLARHSITLSHDGGRRRRHAPPGIDGGGCHDVDVVAFRRHDPDVDFLPLDDVLPVDRSIGKRGINLATDEVDVGDDGDRKERRDVTLLSLGGMMSSPDNVGEEGDGRTPSIAVGGTGGGGRRPFPLDGASPSVMTRALLANLLGGYGADGDGGGGGGGGSGNDCRGGGGGNLRLLGGSCDVGPNGALLMPGTVATIFVNGKESAAAPATGGAGAPSSSSSVVGVEVISAVRAAPSSPGNDNDAFLDCSDDDRGGGGFELYDDRGDYDDDMTTNHPSTTDEDLIAPSTTTFMADDDGRSAKKVGSAPAVPVDPWATLDPHEPSTDKACPIRIGITCRLPPGIDVDDRPSAAVTGSRTRANNERRASSKRRGGVDDDSDVGRRSVEASRRYPPNGRPFLADITFDELMLFGGDDVEDGTRRTALLVKPGALLFGDEFAHVARAHARHRDAVRRRQRLFGHDGEFGATMNVTKDVLDDDEKDEYGGGGGGFDDGGYDDDYSAGPADFDDPHRSIHRSNVDFDAIGDVFTDSAGDGGSFYVDDCDRRDDYDYHDYTNTFEELCRAHLRKFAKSAEIYAAETQLTKRVGRWQMGLAPLLEVQEDRPEFDIHQVGRQILDRIERGISVRKRTSTGEKRLDSGSTKGEVRNNVVGFSTVVTKDCEEFEVCRVFLSTLMLCNCGNIAVQREGAGDDVDLVDSFKIELLNSTFRPPMESLFTPIGNTLYPQETVESSNLCMLDENGSVVEE